MSEYNLKSIRKKFSANGVFYTDKELAERLKSYMPDDLAEVYDPTCGSGSLLSVFGDEVAKYGQELDPIQAEEAACLPNSHIIAGDTLVSPAFMEKRFRGIVANYPFSVKWTPNDADERFAVAPCLAPPSRGDWAFLLHILYLLDDDGVAATLNFPGILYRGQREGRIRQWFVEQGYIHEITRIGSGHFVDTNVETALIIIRKTPTQTILFRDDESKQERVVDFDEIQKHSFNLSVNTYISPPEGIKPKVDPLELEMSARKNALRKVKYEIEFSLAIANLEGWSADEFIEDIISLANSYRKQPLLFP